MVAHSAAVFWDGAQPALRNPRGAAWLWSTGDSTGTALLHRGHEEQAVGEDCSTPHHCEAAEMLNWADPASQGPAGRMPPEREPPYGGRPASCYTHVEPAWTGSVSELPERRRTRKRTRRQRRTRTWRKRRLPGSHTPVWSEWERCKSPLYFRCRMGRCARRICRVHLKNWRHFLW